MTRSFPRVPPWKRSLTWTIPSSKLTPPGATSISGVSYGVVITDGLEADSLHITNSILFPDSTTMTSANTTQSQVNSSTGWIKTVLAARLTSIPSNYLTTSSSIQASQLTNLTFTNAINANGGINGVLIHPLLLVSSACD